MMLVICASRSRPDRIKEMLSSYEETKTGDTDIVIYLDDDDPKLREYQLNGYNVEIGKHRTLGEVANYIIEKYPSYDYYSEINDDMVFKTVGWDKILTDTIKNKGNGWGIAFGDDLMGSGKKMLPTQVVISNTIIKALGYIAPSCLKHLYRDVFWRDLGRGINNLFYCPEVIIEHKHWSIKKSELDDTYKTVNSRLHSEHRLYKEYKKIGLQSDINKVKEAYENSHNICKF